MDALAASTSTVELAAGAAVLACITREVPLLGEYVEDGVPRCSVCITRMKFRCWASKSRVELAAPAVANLSAVPLPIRNWMRLRYVACGH